MTIVYLLRHGETEWNRNGNRFCGKTNISLSDTGYKQAERAQHALAHVPLCVVYCSTLNRSAETASMIAGAHNLPAVQDERLTEIDFGQWEGKSRHEIEVECRSTWADWVADPAQTHAGQTGETATEVYRRANAFMEEVCRTYATGAIAVIGHNTLNRIFIAGVLGAPLASYRRFVHDNAGITILEYPVENGWRIRRMNDTSHLTLNL